MRLITSRLCVLTVAMLLGLSVTGQDAAPRAQSDYDGSISGVTRTVVGRVSVVGKLPPIKPLRVFKNRAFCGATVANETLLVGADGGLRNAVVTLRRLDGRAQARPTSLVLDNKRCAFAPHVQVAPAGSEILLKNSDLILHTVHARLGSETLFNVGLPKWRQVVKRLDRAGVIKIDCDVLHTWMSAAIVVTDSPFFAISDERGYFTIEGLPPGAYDLEVWHEKLGVKTRRLSVNGADAISLEVIYALNHAPK